MKETISKLKYIISFLWEDDKFFMLNFIPCVTLFIWSIYNLDIIYFCMSCYLSYMNLHNLDLKFKKTNIDLLSQRLDLLSERNDKTQEILNKLITLIKKGSN